MLSHVLFSYSVATMYNDHSALNLLRYYDILNHHDGALRISLCGLEQVCVKLHSQYLI